MKPVIRDELTHMLFAAAYLFVCCRDSAAGAESTPARFSSNRLAARRVARGHRGLGLCAGAGVRHQSRGPHVGCETRAGGGSRLLLLDEPFGALDPQVRQALRQGLKAIIRRIGITAIFVTHDQVRLSPPSP